MRLVGVDGCRKGWVAAVWNTREGSIDLAVHARFSSVLAAYANAKAIAVDIPIGLIECRRSCDREARAVLKCRKPSVFPAPDPRVVDFNEYGAANARMIELCGKGLSAQAFAIFPKVAEVDRLITPAMQSRVIEIHPEICFWAMGGNVEVCPTKKSGPGYLARLGRLRANISLPDIEWDKIESGAKGAQPDDVLDAVAAAWTARRWVNGSFGRFPALPQVDARGIRAEIIY